MGIAVVGGGVAGAATAWWLAREGEEVSLFERFGPGHDRGSSHGRSRIYRLAYPDRRYVRLASAAMPLWRELEEAAGTALLTRIGGVDHAPAPAGAIHAIAEALAAETVAFEYLDPPAAAARWPGVGFDEVVLHQPDACRIDADAAVAALLEQAARLGARVHHDTPVHRVEVRGGRAEVVTGGAAVRVDAVVVAAGGWLPGLLAAGGSGPWPAVPPLRVTQEQPAYFGTDLDDEHWPAILHHRPPPDAGEQAPAAFGRYAIHTPGVGLKVGEHGTGVTIADPDARPPVVAAKVRALEDYAARWLPGVRPEATRVDACLYTSTPDESFVLARSGPVVVCSACSGHGFKFAPEIGRRAAELARA